MELISVIIPVYNVEKYLMRCVDSVRSQTYQNLEIILVDDGSPDRCSEMCEEIKQMDSRVKVIHKENGGLGFARNSGLEAVTGEYVTFIDSDDWISQDHIENLYIDAKKNNSDVVIGAHTSVDANGHQKTYAPSVEKNLYLGRDIIDSIVLPIIGTEPACPQDIQLDTSSCMNLYRMAIIRQNNLRFLSEKVAIAEDLYFNIDFFCHAQIVSVIKEFGYYYFENADSISRKYDPKRFERTIRYFEIIRTQIAQYGLEEHSSYRAERSFLLKIRVAIRHIVLSDVSYRDKLQQIKEILNHKLVKEVLSRYPVDQYIPAMRLLAEWMRSGNTLGVYWLMKMREFAKQQAWMKRVLKGFGIGK